MSNVKISPSEMELMQILWSNGGYMSIPQVLEKTSGQWKYTTVATFMTRLKSKGFLNSRKCGAQNEFCAAITLDEYKKAEAGKFVNELYGGSAKNLIASLCEDRLDDDDYRELMNWLEKIK